MSLTREQFVEQLRRDCPELDSIIDEHLGDFDGEVLLHLLVADVLRLAIELFEAHEIEALDRCLSVVAAGLGEGDEYVQNTVAVSFVEDTPWWDETKFPFIAAWPEVLRAEAERFRVACGGSA
jgi:hypothetical protein